jgi:transcriptional regulator with XRE-family HTH domain
MLRGLVPLSEMARLLGISKGHLANLEAGRKIPDEERARDLLRRGFHLPQREVTRLILEVQLRDYGLRDRVLRQLVIDLIQRRVPAPIRQELRWLYRNYADKRAGGLAPHK